MNKETVAFSHKGFFGVCPIILTDPHESAPMIEPRWRILDTVLIMNEMIAGLIISFKTKFDPGWQPVYPVWKVKQMRKPIYRDFEIED